MYSGDRVRQVCCALGIVLLVAVTLYGRVILAGEQEPVRLVIYAFSTQEEALTQRILPDFEQAWQAETGQDLIIEAVFGPSGTLAGQINLGAPADIALVSNIQHVNWLKLGKRVRWETEPVVIGYTPMVIVTRPGNPAGIAGFADLARPAAKGATPSLNLIHADPRSSGAGEWTVLAEYGSAFLESNDQDAAAAQLRAIWRNVRLLSPSARAALALFEVGAGDALVTYEQDARLALERGVPLEIVVPPGTIMAQHMAVAIDDNITTRERPAVAAFLNYLAAEAGQQAFGDYHLRPAAAAGGTSPDLVRPFTVQDLGGWSRAYDELINRLWRSEIESRLDTVAAPTLLEPRGE